MKVFQLGLEVLYREEQERFLRGEQECRRSIGARHIQEVPKNGAKGIPITLDEERQVRY